MVFAVLRQKSAPFDIKHKKTGEVETVVGFSKDKRVTLFTKVFLKSGKQYSMRYFLKSWDLI